MSANINLLNINNPMCNGVLLGELNRVNKLIFIRAHAFILSPKSTIGNRHRNQMYHLKFCK